MESDVTERLDAVRCGQVHCSAFPDGHCASVQGGAVGLGGVTDAVSPLTLSAQRRAACCLRGYHAFVGDPRRHGSRGGGEPGAEAMTGIGLLGDSRGIPVYDRRRACLSPPVQHAGRAPAHTPRRASSPRPVQRRQLRLPNGGRRRAGLRVRLACRLRGSQPCPKLSPVPDHPPALFGRQPRPKLSPVPCQTPEPSRRQPRPKFSPVPCQSPSVVVRQSESCGSSQCGGCAAAATVLIPSSRAAPTATRRRIMLALPAFMPTS